jgi:hypothetical protein
MDSHTEDNEMKNVTLAVGFALSFAIGAHAQVPAQGPICIKPEQIERVEVLKGARAQQEYGIRDGESVIIFTTKVSGAGGTFRDCPAGDDQLERLFFPPELVMSNQDAIGLTTGQRSEIQTAVKIAQASFVDTQFKLRSEMERLKALLGSTPTDESKVLEQIDRVLAMEREMKRAQLSLMIRIKNQLSDQQRAMLSKIRGDQGGDAVSPGRGRGRPQ